MALLSSALVLWQIDGPLEQSIGASLEPASRYSFYVPAIDYLESHSGGAPMRIEVPFTKSHWDATILGERFDLARGWERQLDTRYDDLFYAPPLTARAYHAWLLGNRRALRRPVRRADGLLQRARGSPDPRWPAVPARGVYERDWRIYAVIAPRRWRADRES